MKIIGKQNTQFGLVSPLPILGYSERIACRTLLLNCLTKKYSDFWEKSYKLSFVHDLWSKTDLRLRESCFANLSFNWTLETPLGTDYERRQVLVEIDVLISIALEMTLSQLLTIYRIQFPVLKQYEADTWYDANGRIVFTNNRSLTNVGFFRTEWEKIKNAQAGEVFTRTITDDTMPGGPVERTIEYVAPFDRCDREQDYETV